MGVGILIALLPGSILFEHHTYATANHFFNSEYLSSEAENLRKFLFAPIGGTVAGYFLLQSFIVWGPFTRKEPWAWHAITGALLLWFVIDSSMSFYHGAIYNVWMINLWTLLLVGLPLVMTYKYFRIQTESSFITQLNENSPKT